MQFAETDMAGFVHFSCFFRFMEEAEHALWRQAGLSIVPSQAEIGFPRLATSFEYLRPLYFEDEFEVCIRIAEITDKTMRYTCELIRDGEKIGAGSLTMGCVRKVADEPIRMTSIPSDIRDRFEVAPGLED